MYYTWINKNLVHQVEDQTKVYVFVYLMTPSAARTIQRPVLGVMYYEKKSKRKAAIVWRAWGRITRQATYVQRKIEASSLNHSCCGKDISIKYYECLYSCLSDDLTCKPRLISVTCGSSGITKFFHIISQTARTQEKQIMEHNMCFNFVYNFRLKYFQFWEELSEIWS
jgi:hypothetical protein